ncbi:MAG: hypothetical protein L0228_14175 [Planctomycetes bacterium]|nr:hypothetical protein [Planctomycetota bacterium]
MSELLFQYQRVHATTWAYLASLLVIALYFKFNRVWSMRNWDLLGLILLAPPLLMVQYGIEHAGREAASGIEYAGYIWLFAVSGVFMLRLLLDAFMVRRPLLEPNLAVGGLTFLGISLFVFLMANVITGTPDQADVVGSQQAGHLREMTSMRKDIGTLKTHGPGFPLIFLLPHISTQSLLGEEGQEQTILPSTQSSPAEVVQVRDVVTVRVMAILSQLAIVLGLVFVGLRHFDNMKTGIAAATLYLLLPYTAMWTGHVTHALPGALLVWAIVLYRRPLLAGAMIGLAFGTIYYPIFLLPLWISFYWQRGRLKFLIGAVAMLAILILSLAIMSSDVSMFLDGLRQMFNLRMPALEPDQLSGAWQFWKPVYRLPIFLAYVGLCLSMALWPAQKNLGVLISYSAAVMLGTQFWHAHSGGLALAWYLPLLLLTIFRPNLEDRVAPAVVR